MYHVRLESHKLGQMTTWIRVDEASNLENTQMRERILVIFTILWFK